MQSTAKSTFQPFRLDGFRRLVSAAFVSGLGGSLIPIAFTLESHRIEPSGWGLTVVLLSLWGGRFVGMLVVQRSGPARNPVRMMIGSDVVRFIAQAGLLAWLVLGGVASDGPGPAIMAMAVSSAVYGIATSFFQPARFTAIPRIVPAKYHGQANAWLSILGDAFAIAGPLAGSVVVLLLGFNAVLLIDAVGFLIGIILLAGVRIPASVEVVVPSTDEKIVKTERVRTNLPRWVNMGLLTWLFVALTIGLLGTAGPTLVIERNSPQIWAVTAACMAVGSLLGSASSLLGVLRKVPWKYLHLLCCVGIALQLLCFLFVPVPLALWAAGFIGSALTTVSGIRWDTLGQSIGDEVRVHTFAARDQIVNTVGIPAGMLVFGVASATGTTTVAVITISATVALMGALVLFSGGTRKENVQASLVAEGVR